MVKEGEVKEKKEIKRKEVKTTKEKKQSLTSKKTPKKLFEKEIEIPEKVDVSIDGKNVKISGEKGSLTREFRHPRFNKFLKIEKNGNKVSLYSARDRKEIKAVIGTIAAHLKNMFLGVTIGFKYTMKVYHVHFPVSIAIKDKYVEIKNFIGEKTLRKAKIIGDTEVKVEKDEIILTGISIEEVGETATNIENAGRLSKRDKRVFLDGIYISGKYLQNDQPLKVRK